MASDLSASTRHDRPADADAIHELLDRQTRGWNAGDAEAYASVFTPDADYVTFLGSRYKGRPAIAASYTPLFRKLLKGSRLRVEVTQLRFLTPDVALIQANAAVSRATRRWNRPITRVNTSIAVRTTTGWLLAASQNTTHRRLAQNLMTTLVSRRLHT
jgi:uncharacterized protein (TIGR02246 family)